MAAESSQPPRVTARGPELATALIVAVAAICWAVVAAQARAMGSTAMGLGTLPSFTGTWTVMMAAMMLPSVVSFVRRYTALPGQHVWLIDTILMVLAYLAVWALFGIGGYFALTASGMPWQSQDRVLGIALVVAGMYALTRVQRAFATRCQTMCDGIDQRARGEAITTGLAYGVNCVGCSAGVMVVMLVAGMSNVVLMVIAAAIILFYKVTPRARRLDAAVALIMVVLGLWSAALPATVPSVLLP
jgi:predicted metal-binding membrane protein